MVEVGSIVKIKNICFKDGRLDHSYKCGRPCVYIGEVDEKMYFITFSSFNKKRYYKTLKPNDSNNLTKTSQINVKNVIVKDLFYPYITGVVTDEELEIIFKTIKKYYKTVRNDIDRNVVFLADKYLNGKYVDDNAKDLMKNGSVDVK